MFFIGSPASKGLFFRQLWREPDPFNQMRESLGAIMRVLAVKLVDPVVAGAGGAPLALRCEIGRLMLRHF